MMLMYATSCIVQSYQEKHIHTANLLEGRLCTLGAVSDTASLSS